MSERNWQHRDGGHRHHPEYVHDGSLPDLLDRCGHYYAHRVGASHRGQESVLSWLAEHPDVTQKELGEGLGITPASLSEVLTKLERKGHVVRVKDEYDRRFVRVRLTAEGEQVLEAQAHETDDPFSALTDQEQETLARLLGKLLDDWEKRYISQRKGRGHRDLSRHGEEHPDHEGRHCGERGASESEDDPVCHDRKQ